MLQTRRKNKIQLRPEDHGRRMSLKDFEPAEWREGVLYELARGVVVVSDVPGFKHLRVVSGIRDQIILYKIQNPGEIYEILGTMECKVLVEDLESERHPDLAIFKKAPPERVKLWRNWVPEVVIEVVSKSSEDRDYVEKREEYYARGIQEYWIVDPQRHRLLVLKRTKRGWTEHFLQSGTYQTKLLPGFVLDLARVFAAGEE